MAETAAKLRRQLDGTTIGLLTYGSIIGSGLFLASAVVLKAAGAYAIFGYAAGAVLATLEMVALAEMAVSSPVPGAFATIARHVWGETAGEAVGYLYVLAGITGLASEVIATGLLVRAILPVLPLWLPTLVLAAVAYLVNRLSVRLFGRLEGLVSVAKAVVIVAFLATLIALRIAHPQPFVALRGSLFGVLVSMPAVFFAYSGTGVMAIAAAEAREPRRDIPRALFVAVGLITLSYLLTIGGTLVHVPWHAVIQNQSPMVQALAMAGFRSAGWAFDLVLAFVTFATLTAGIYTNARMLQALAAAGKAPRALAALDRSGVPGGAVLTIAAALALVSGLSFVLPQTVFALLVNSAGDLTLATWSFVFLTHLRMRRTRSFPFRLPGFPWTDYVGVAAVLAVVVLAALSPTSRTGLIVAVCLGTATAGAVAVTARGRRRAA